MDEGSEYSIHSLCRICLNHLRNDPAYDLFLVPGLAKKLCVCTSLSVEEHDGFPKNICGSCYTQLNALHGFQKLCVDSVQKFQEMLASKYFVPVMADVDKVDLMNATVPDGDMDEDRTNFDPLLNTKIEVVETEDVFKMLDDVDKEVEEVEKELSSEAEFENDDDPEFEVNSSDSNDALPLSRLKTVTRASKAKRKPVVDDKDKDKDKDSSDFEWEMDNDFDKEEPKTKSRRKRVSKSKVKQDDAIDCHICNEKFNSTKLYDEHMKHHNDLLPFQCTVETCKKGFTTSGGLRLHMDHAHSELSEVHACSVEGCGMTFPRPVLLTNHLKKVHQIITSRAKDHPCTVCEKVFRCSTALKKHMYKHTGEEKPISCNICNKRFHINSELKDHLLRHAGVKNHVCPYCGVGKTTRQEWNKHILTHTKEKQFQCDQCDHSSHNKQALANHIKVVHMKIKNYACQYCGKTFGKSYACKVHERIHTRENCSQCNICGKVLLFERSLTKHLKTHEKRELRATAAKGRGKDGAQSSQDTTEPAEMKLIPTEPPKPKNGNRLERVDISELAGTAVNPIPTVSVASWSPQVNFTKKEGQHICPGCGRGFNHIGNMKIHFKIVHLKVKDFACRFCPKRFSKAQILQHHEWTHTGEKPFPCKYCGRHFRQEKVMKIHARRVHENPKKPEREAKPPKEPKPPKDPNREKRPKMNLNEKPPKILDEYQDPAAERAAARAALLAQQKEEYEAKQRAEEEARKIQEAACAQLHMLQKEQLINKLPSDSFQVKKPETGISVDDLKGE
ncbi:zinc finger protein 135 [Drosophila mojavensis]|uniref:Uncharacterized protein n=1 Tax=Drosophila mojavensis TaxID=7230 RepID=B4KVR3_DROMO|nr:zinc finger protein 135 [Drosophila mojavensis]EDW18437.2 uncharacterized protein Dmoj_GI13235 [Drosophila mojavensis]